VCTGVRVYTASSMHVCICVCPGACVCTVSCMSHIFNINCQKSNQDHYVCVRVRAHVRACVCGHFCGKIHTPEHVSVYTYTRSHTHPSMQVLMWAVWHKFQILL